ncbi:unnamed protein product [Haemonchus placei]|uniref:Uncharacterized protein n=1 Tax=Haemonchus placei TaxID=6290 RepID=A0A3P7Z8Q4_HAEPC|nr:unnamed protein product [Haemonchus placei]
MVGLCEYHSRVRFLNHGSHSAFIGTTADSARFYDFSGISVQFQPST